MKSIKSFILFYSVLSYTIFFLALFHKAQSIWVGSIALLLISLFLVFNVKDLYQIIINHKYRAISFLPVLLFIPLLHVFLIPPYLRDDMIYHLVVPKLIALTGGLVNDPWNINANFPFLFELPLTVLEFQKQWLSPFIVNFCMLFLLSAVSYAFAKRHCDIQQKWILLSILCVVYTPVLYEQIHSCYVEIFFTLLIVIGFSDYLDYKKSGDPKFWLSASVFIGLSCAVKYFGLVYLLFIALYEFFTGKKRVLLYSGLAVAILVCFPWYLKNWIETGNPFYPMMSTLFPSEFLSFAREKHFVSLANSYHDGKSVLSFILVPLKLFSGYSQSIKPGMLGFGGTISLFYVLSFFGSFKNPYYRIINLLFISYGLIWLFTSQQVRFLMPVLLLASLIGLVKFCEFFKTKPWILWIFFLSIFAQSVFLIWKNMKEEKIADLLFGHITKSEFLRYQMPYSYDIADYVNKNFNKPNTKILTEGIFGRVYYFNVPTITVTYYDEEPFDVAFNAKKENVASLESFLKKEKITHILLNRTFFLSEERLNAPIDFKSMQGYFDQKTELVYSNGPAVLLKIKNDN